MPTNITESNGVQSGTTKSGETQEGSAGVPSLKGWAAIADYMRRHDEGVVKDFANDVDTLLVFAGLFSAVLTTFLSQTYQSLQPDNSQLTVELLSQISTQLGSLTISRPFVNSTTSPPLSTSDSVSQSPSAIAINSLWFLSLVFSLSAALFGIHVKQWLREYIKWNSVLAPDRENVLIRQARLEAWERWKVSAIIAAIPALLEIAVVLFYIGMIVFLWTLDRTVSIIVTVAIAIFLAITVLFTVLPVFSRRCPYRSPTGWTFLYIVEYFRRFFHRPLFRKMPSVQIVELTPNWRRRDLQFIVMQDEYLGSGEFAFLYRAFVWIRCASESDALSYDILQSLQSFHEDGTAQNPHQVTSETDSARYSSVMSVIREHHIFGELLRNEGLLLYRTVNSPDGCDEIESYMLTGPCVPGQRTILVRGRTYLSHLTPASAPIRREGTVHMTRLVELVKSALANRKVTGVVNTYHDAQSLWVMHRLALGELRLQAETLFQQFGSSDLEHLKKSTARIAEMIVLLYPFRRDTSQAIRRALDPTFTVELGTVLVDIFHKVSHLSDSHRTGITAMILEILCLSGEVSFESDNDNLLRAQPVAYNQDVDPDVVLRRAITMATHFSKGRGDSPAYRHMFVLLVNFCLRAVSWDGKEVHTMVEELLSLMKTAAEESMLADDNNCGGFVDLPWIDQLKDMLQGEKRAPVYDGIFSGQTARKPLVQLLSILERSLEAELITGDTAAEDLEECFQLLRVYEDDSGGLPPNWGWRIDTTGDVYYHNSETRTSTTIRPETQTEGTADATDVPTSIDTKDGTEEVQGVPAAIPDTEGQVSSRSSTAGDIQSPPSTNPTPDHPLVGSDGNDTTMSVRNESPSLPSDDPQAALGDEMGASGSGTGQAIATLDVSVG